MNKKEVQKRVLRNGKPLALSKFAWCEKTRAFSSSENYLVLDFNGISACTFTTGAHCTFTTGDNCTFATHGNCTFTTWDSCTFDTGSGCTFDTGDECVFATYSNCAFTTGAHCAFTTGSGCTFATADNCTFTAYSRCTFTTRGGCTFKTDDTCTFNTGNNCVIVRRDVFEVIQPIAGDVIQLCPRAIAGHLVNGELEGVPHIIADGILSRIINKKGDVYKVANHGEDVETFLVEQGEIFSHGATIKEARDSLIYKLVNKDTSAYVDMTLETELSLAESIEMYRTITGACESGVKYFVEQNQDKVKDKFTVKELISLTSGQYASNAFKEFFGGNVT